MYVQYYLCSNTLHNTIFAACEENDDMRNDTERNDSEIEKILDNTTTDVHVGQSAAKSQGHFQFYAMYSLSNSMCVALIYLSSIHNLHWHNRNTPFDNQ